jgi:hypothetical protein
LEICLTNETVAVLTVEKNMIVYQQYDYDRENDSRKLQNSIELCPGKIYFETIDNGVIYYLNGEKHVVHLRVAEQP